MVDHINPYQVKEKHLKKTRSDNSNVRNDVRRHRDYGRVNSCPGETFVTISEVSLRTKPSHLPPPSRPPPAAATGVTNGSISSWKTGYMDGNQENNSTSLSPFFDVEVDASSSAAAVASAAAMEEAMLKAQAQLRSAKELMEKKKESRKNHARMDSNGEWKDMGGNHLNDVVQGSSQGKSSEMKIFIMEEPRDVMGMECAVRDSLEGEKLQNQHKQSAEEVQGQKTEYGDMFSKIEDVGQWKEATQFFEMAWADRSGAVLAQMDKEKDLSEGVRSHDNGEMKGTIGGFEWQQNFDMMKATVTKRVPREDYVADAKKVIRKASKEVNTEENAEKKKNASQQMSQLEEAKTTHRKTRYDREIPVNLNGSASSGDQEGLNVLIEVAPKFEVELLMDGKKDGLKLKKYCRRLETEENIAEGHGKACNEKRPKEASEREGKEKRPVLVTELKGNEKRDPQLYGQEEEEDKQRMNLESACKEANEREESERRLRETFELEENEKILREILEQEERKEFKEVHMQEGNDKRMKENLELAENKRKQEDAVREEQERRLKEALEREENEKSLREALEKTEKEKLNEVLEQEKNDKKLVEPCAQEEEEQRIKEDIDREEIRMLKEASEWEESKKRLNETCEQEQMNKKLEEAQEMVENVRRLGEDFSGEQTEERTPEAKGRGKSENSCQEPCQDEDEGKNLKHYCMHESIGARDERDVDRKEVDDVAMDTFELEELDKWLEEVDIEECDDLSKADKKVEDCIQNDTKNILSNFPAPGSEQVLGESRDATDTSDDGGLIKAEFKGSRNELPANEKEEEGSKTEDSVRSPSLVDQPKQTNLEIPEVFSEMSYDSRQWDEKYFAQQLRETKENNKKSETCFGEDGNRLETSQPAALNAHGTSQQLQDANPAEGREENLNRSVKAQEKEIERLGREQEMEKDRLRKIEEEREREREREKDRMAIDKATLEARERAYAEAREKAERAAVERAIAEARQRSLAEARERLEKACAEAREQSFLEKTSIEARTRAERAAVERATTEARERATSRYNGMRQSNLRSVSTQTILNEKFAYCCDKVDKLVIRKKRIVVQSTKPWSSQDPHELKHQTVGSSSSTRYQYSSGNGGMVPLVIIHYFAYYLFSFVSY